MTTPVDQNRTTMQELYGGTILWSGVEDKGWGPADITTMARQARALGFDSICVKRADGGQRWYSSPEQLAQEAAAAAAEGCGYIPYAYCYGPRFTVRGEAFPGKTQVEAECAILLEMARAVPAKTVQADMEVEYNGAVQCADLFCSIMRPATDVTLSVSTWADPLIQNWSGVAAALAPCVNAWVVQRYTDWLANQPLPAEETCVMPGVDLSQEFGANHPVTIAAGHPSVFVWYDGFAFQAQYQASARAIASRAGRVTPPPSTGPAPSPAPADPAPEGTGETTEHQPEAAPDPAPSPAPSPAPAVTHYRVAPGDSLWTIAQREYGTGQLWHVIYDANRDIIGPDPDLIRIGVTLQIPPKPAE